MTETCKNNFSKFVGSLLNHLYHYRNENVSVTLLSLICITSILSTIYSLKIVSFMVNLAVITALTHSGTFGDIFVSYRISYMFYNKESVKFPAHYFHFLKYILIPKRTTRRTIMTTILIGLL